MSVLNGCGPDSVVGGMCAVQIVSGLSYEVEVSDGVLVGGWEVGVGSSDE